MIRCLFLFALLCAAAAFAQQQGATVTAKELPAPASAQTHENAEPQDSPQPAVPQTAASTGDEPSNVETPAEQHIIRPSELPRDKRSTKRVAAFWLIVPGK